MKNKAGLLLLAGLSGLSVLFFVGPTIVVNKNIKDISLPDDLDQYLAQSEAKFTDITPNTEKKIFWANPDKTKTHLSIVYLHGYSATRHETSPLADDIAAKLNANLFYTRLAGHGRPGYAMTEPSVNDWLNDTLEAVEIGKRLGDKVIVIGVSTGATLATWLAMQPYDSSVLAYVMISPNYGPKDPQSELLTLPWAQLLVPPILGPEYSWEPENPENAMYWTHKYPTKALFQMMALVKYVRKSKLETIKKPVMFIYSKLDSVTNIRETEKQIARFSSKQKTILALTEKVNKENHVLAGNILAPDNTVKLEQPILDFIRGLK